MRVCVSGENDRGSLVSSDHYSAPFPSAYIVGKFAWERQNYSNSRVQSETFRSFGEKHGGDIERRIRRDARQQVVRSEAKFIEYDLALILFFNTML